MKTIRKQEKILPMGTSEVTLSYSNSRYCKQDAKSEDWSKNVVNWHTKKLGYDV